MEEEKSKSKPKSARFEKLYEDFKKPLNPRLLIQNKKNINFICQK